MSALNDAAERGDLEAVTALLAGGERFDDAAEALVSAIWAGHLTVAERMIAKGVGVVAPADEMSALHAAAARGHASLIPRLIAAGAPVEARAWSGAVSPTPLMKAVDEDQAEAVRLLWDAKPPTREELLGKEWHWMRQKSGRAAVVLAEKTGDANLGSCFGLTGLHHAVLGRDAASLKALLAMGADPAAKTTEEVKLYVPIEIVVRAGTTALDLAVASRKKKADPALVAIEALLAAGKPAKKAAAKKAAKPAKVEMARGMITAPGDHRHPGARAIPDRFSSGLFCAFCGSARSDDFPALVVLAPAQVDARALPLFNARWDHLERGIDQDQAKSMGRISKALANKLDALPEGATWKSDSLGGRKDPLRAKASNEALRPDDAVEARLFGELLAAQVAGKDDLALLGPLLDDRDAKVACAAARLLRQDHLRMPAWFYNPALPVDAAAIEKLEAVREGKGPVFSLWSPDREVATARLLIRALSDPRLDVAFSAAGSLPRWGVPTAANHPVWALLGEDDRARARDHLLLLLDRATKSPPRVMGDVQMIITSLLGKLGRLDAPRLRALSQALAGGALSWAAGELAKLAG
jgi:hypothetical protein